MFNTTIYKKKSDNVDDDDGGDGDGRWAGNI